MALHSVKGFGRYVASLPATSVVAQWECQVAKVGDKVFALVTDEGGAITFKVNEIAFEGLTALEGVGQAPYFAKRAWVSVGKGAALSDADLKAYVAASHRMVAAKLTRKAKAALGLEAYLTA